MTIGTQLILASKGIEYPLLVDFNVIPTVRPRLVSLCRRNDSVVRIGDAYCYSKAICKLVWCQNSRELQRPLNLHRKAFSRPAVAISQSHEMVCFTAVRLPSEETLKVKANKQFRYETILIRNRCRQLRVTPCCTCGRFELERRVGDSLSSRLSSENRDESYLVDPASSHMLVSKIKPCMSKYKLLYGETANGSLNQLSSI